MGFQFVDGDVQAGFHRLDKRQHDAVRRHSPQAHAHQGQNRHPHPGRPGRNPQADRDEVEEHDQKQDDEHQNDQTGKSCDVHVRSLLVLRVSPAADAAAQREPGGSALASSGTLFTVTRLPTMCTISTGAPGGMKAPSDTASIRNSPTCIVPAGRSGDSARPLAPTLMTGSSGSSCSKPGCSKLVSRESLRQIPERGTRLKMKTAPASVSAAAKPTAASADQMSGNDKNRLAKTATIPSTPAMPNPGMTRISRSSKPTPSI